MSVCANTKLFHFVTLNIFYEQILVLDDKQYIWEIDTYVGKNLYRDKIDGVSGVSTWGQESFYLNLFLSEPWA